MSYIHSTFVAAGSISSATSIDTALTNPIAGEVGVLLLITAIGFLVGFLLRRVYGALRLVSLLVVALLLLAWAGGVAINTTNIATSIDLIGLLRQACDAWNKSMAWTPLRAGVGAVGFVAGVCFDLRARRAA